LPQCVKVQPDITLPWVQWSMASLPLLGLLLGDYV
jgi:hypothetical protein